MVIQTHKAKGGLLHDTGTHVRRANTPEESSRPIALGSFCIQKNNKHPIRQA